MMFPLLTRGYTVYCYEVLGVCDLYIVHNLVWQINLDIIHIGLDKNNCFNA